MTRHLIIDMDGGGAVTACGLRTRRPSPTDTAVRQPGMTTCVRCRESHAWRDGRRGRRMP